MKTVNPYFLHKLIAPLAGLADEDMSLEKYGSLNPNDLGQLGEVIRRELRPHFLALNAEGKDRAKLALAYYLSREGSDFGRVLDSSLLPFDSPDDPRNFFVLLWAELFPEEELIPIDISGFKEVPDIHEPNRY
jgi:hypothetical protein